MSTTFVIKNSPLVHYNGIPRGEWIHTMKAVPSSYHKEALYYNRNEEDKLIWKEDLHEKFLVKSAYAATRMKDNTAWWWKYVWSIGVHPRLSGFASRMVNPILPLMRLSKEKNYLFHGESTQHSQSDANASIPVEAAAPQKEKGKGRKKRAPTKQRPNVQVSEDAEFLDETDDAGMHWTGADFTCLAKAWENDVHKIYKGLNDVIDFKHREAYKILVREPRWPT
ncbi:hypothetical protein GIB67_003307 [Kingdonia uniflora]|uniref:Uncharacterized protein n=1 Tax=Kingdonia uniflora TaxID=39325 RepID=A0A7J7P8T2_9MAGN|nr:hypothetical protein GIB67_003307 [Kingdonia uniflora]